MVENKGSVPCDFAVTMGSHDGESQANVAAVQPGKRLTLVVGNSPTMLRTITIKRGSEEQTVEENAGLPPGERFLIVVDAAGKVSTEMSAR